LEWTASGDSYCVASGIDLLGALSLYTIQASTTLTLTAQARLAFLCGLAGIPVGQQNFQNGSYAIQAELYTNTDILTACQQCVASQGQVIYSNRSGVLTSLGMFGSIGNLGTFGDGPGELPIGLLEPSIGGGYLYTVVSVQATAASGGQVPPPATAKTSTAQVARYGTRVLSRNTSALTLANEQAVATSLAASLLTHQGLRVKQLTIRPMRNPALIWPVVLANDLGNSYTIHYSPPGGLGPRFSQGSTCRSIASDLTASDWVFTWNMSP
jgi:hypothetical protein